MALINQAQACNVFWRVGSSATLGTGTSFAGTVLALTSITAQSGTTASGRLLARNGVVTTRQQPGHRAELLDVAVQLGHVSDGLRQQFDDASDQLFHLFDDGADQFCHLFDDGAGHFDDDGYHVHDLTRARTPGYG